MSRDNPLASKLSNFTRLSTEDRAVLDGLVEGRVRHCSPRQDIILEGETPRELRLFLAGWACRYKMLEDGRRQIVAVLLPGDICDLHMNVLREMDHTVTALTPVSYVDIQPATIEAIIARHPRITQALLWDGLVTSAIQREWVLNLGKRSALERIAHLLCELFTRVQAVGLAVDNRCEMPLTQSDLAETTGLSAVHVNRTLQELRSQGLIVLRDRDLTILNFEELRAVAGFNPNYLHLGREGRHLDSNDS